jgi:hypothetical protein
VVTGQARYITGCDQYALTRIKPDGDSDIRWLDDNRLKVLDNPILELPKLESGARGGPVAFAAPTK